MTDTMLTAETAALRADFAGRLLVPGHNGYDEARPVWNGMVDKRPATIAQCATAVDVAAALDFGRTHGLEIAVRSGGHSVAGNSLTDGGIVIDLRQMNTVEIDPDSGSSACTAAGAVRQCRGQELLGDVVFALPPREVNDRDLVGRCVAADCGDEGSGDRFHQRTRGNRHATMALENPHNAQVALQLRDVEVEVEPVDAFHLQGDMVGQHLSSAAG